MAKKGQKFQHYKTTEKEEILKKYYAGVTSKDLSQQYGLSDNTIRMWVFNIKHNKCGKKRGRPKTTELTKEDYMERYEILKKYQAFLEARHGKK